MAAAWPLQAIPTGGGAGQARRRDAAVGAGNGAAAPAGLAVCRWMADAAGGATMAGATMARNGAGAGGGGNVGRGGAGDRPVATGSPWGGL